MTSFFWSLPMALLLLLLAARSCSAAAQTAAEASSSSQRWQAELLRETEEEQQPGCPAVAMVQVGSGAATATKKQGDSLPRRDSVPEGSSAANASSAAAFAEVHEVLLPGELAGQEGSSAANASSAAASAEVQEDLLPGELAGQGRGLLLLEEQATVKRSSAPMMGILVMVLSLVILVVGCFTLVSATKSEGASKAAAAIEKANGPQHFYAKASGGRTSIGRPASGLGSRAMLTPAPGQKDSLGPTPRETLLPASGALQEFVGLPAMCPELGMTANVTRLALPVADLEDPCFEFDVLTAEPGQPAAAQVLTARAVSNSFDGRRHIELRLHESDKLLAVITPDLQIMKASGEFVGRLSKQTSAAMVFLQSGGGGQQQHVLLNAFDKKVMAITSGHNLLETTMVGQAPASESHVSIGRQQQKQLAIVARKPAGELPAEHFEATISQNVDSVLVLSCFLALAAFAREPASTMPAIRSRTYASAGATVGLSSPTMTHSFHR
eukprot:TRINITY_DN8361_c0_g1_i1.p1 TRINITY_DN8361_c0_g1~~TRINITY_DN8361_c0_g1_i1.p1  ORF type:complete len:497 (+),score=116.74 TRINITY_DN8361_c0_g1_i1:180-1670(+)